MQYALRAAVGVLVALLIGGAVYAGPVADFLAVNPAVAAQICLETGSPGAYLAYEEWPESWVERLEEMVSAYVAGEPLPFTIPVEPASLDAGDSTVAAYASLDLGRDAYLAQIGHMLYLEMEERLPWSLAGYTDDELSYLFSSSNYFRLAESGGSLIYRTSMGPEGQDAAGLLGDPRDVFGFLLEEPEQGRALLGSSQEETVANLSEWFHDYLHALSLAATESPEAFYRQYPYFTDRLRRLPVEDLGDVYVAIDGSWSASALFAQILRATNIPVKKVIVALEDAAGREEEHAGLVISVSGEARYLPLIDDLYTGWALGANPMLPSVSTGWALWWNVWLDEATFFSISARHLDARVLARLSYEAIEQYRADAAWNMATYGTLVSVCTYRTLSGCQWEAMSNAVMFGLQDQRSLTIDEARSFWTFMQDVLAHYGNDPCEACERIDEAQREWCTRTGRCDETAWPDR